MTDTSTAGFGVRWATAEDAPLVLEFIRDLAAHGDALHEVKATAEDLRATLLDRQSGTEVVIGEYEGRAIAFAVFFRNYSTFLGCPGMYLEDIYVKPEMRGRGFGKTLLQFLAALAVERNYGRMDWSVRNRNTQALAFYRRIGAEAKSDTTAHRLSGDALRALTAGHKG